MSYAALANTDLEGDNCPGKFEVWGLKDDGSGKFLWCADSCPSPWEKDVWMDSGQETCTMPWSDYEKIAANSQRPADESNGTGTSRAGTNVALWAVVGLVVVGGVVWYAS